MSRDKTESIKQGLDQVRQEVDRWPSWMKTNNSESTRQDSYQSGGQSCSPGGRKNA